MSEHTKEPWLVTAPIDCGPEWGVDAGIWGIAICADAPGNGTSEANARRIVACVNACAGIPTADLEACPDRGLFHLADHANQLVIQRDELLAALENLLKAADLFFAENEGLCGREQARAAIASAKGGAA